MVNPGVVNARPSCLPRADFCEIFPVSGRFLYFKNPFKYAGSFDLNHETVHPAGLNARDRLIYTRNINNLRKH